MLPPLNQIWFSKPEDLCCCENHSDNKTLCEKCWLPICTECADHLKDAKLPPLSYANDMWTGYGLEMVYKLQVTVIELACASPCLTSLVLMSMESKYRQQSSNAVFDEEAHMARHRYGARGNVCSFPLPMEALLKQLQEHMASPDGAADIIPRSGKELGEVFRVILKTNKTGKTTDQEVKTLIHQAKVRRQARVGSKHGNVGAVSVSTLGRFFNLQYIYIFIKYVYVLYICVYI